MHSYKGEQLSDLLVSSLGSPQGSVTYRFLIIMCELCFRSLADRVFTCYCAHTADQNHSSPVKPYSRVGQFDNNIL